MFFSKEEKAKLDGNDDDDQLTELRHRVVLLMRELLLRVRRALHEICLYQILRFLLIFLLILDFVVRDSIEQPKREKRIKREDQRRRTSAF